MPNKKKHKPVLTPVRKSKMRVSATRLLTVSRPKDEATRLEAAAFAHGSKYALLVRRMARGLTLEEACTELEPLEEHSATVVAEGDLQCGACKSKRIHRVERQTRSADESATVFCLCAACGKRWKF